MEVLKLNGSAAAIPSRGSFADNDAVKSSRKTQDHQNLTSNHQSQAPKDVVSASVKGGAIIEQRGCKEAMQRATGTGDDGVQWEHATKLASTSPIFLHINEAKAQEIAVWIEEHRRCLRPSQEASIDYPETSMTPNTTFSRYYPVELDMSDGLETPAHVSDRPVP